MRDVKGQQHKAHIKIMVGIFTRLLNASMSDSIPRMVETDKNMKESMIFQNLVVSLAVSGSTAEHGPMHILSKVI
jgi:hypothetical protein